MRVSQSNNASCDFFHYLRRGRVVNNIANDSYFPRIFRADNILFSTQKRAVFKDNIGGDDLRGETKIRNASHNERKGNGLQSVNHNNSPRIINERAPLPFSFSHELVGIDTDDENVARASTSNEKVKMVKMHEVERS